MARRDDRGSFSKPRRGGGGRFCRRDETVKWNMTHLLGGTGLYESAVGGMMSYVGLGSRFRGSRSH